MIATRAVLVVDDNALAGLAIASLLRLDGFQAVAVRSARDARAHLKAHVPDVILLDVQMPETNGLELTRELKSTPLTCAIPIVIMTARDLPVDRVLAFEAGCEEFVSKPVPPAELGSLLHRVITESVAKT